MSDVADWLETYGGVEIWVGASDQVGNDMIKWTGGDEITEINFWIPGEPDHGNGDCVYLDASFQGLRMSDCGYKMYFVCQSP